MKVWDKGTSLHPKVEKFTIGKDHQLDLILARFDILASFAHIKMLESVGLMSAKEVSDISLVLAEMLKKAEQEQLLIEPEVEDIHSQVEKTVTDKLGDLGKKIHTGRSRNDQILVDIHLYMREEIKELVKMIVETSHMLLNLSEKYKDVLMPGYTHLQIAMPSSFGIWFGAYAESFADDLLFFQSAYRFVNQNPLGSGAGYGSSFPLKRKITTDILGFNNLQYNVLHAQLCRGKTEKIIAQAMSNAAVTLGKLSADICLYLNQNFNFISFPEEFTTGSSIMPHKKNPDVFELIRARCNQIQSIPNEIGLIAANLPSGYHRDFQLLKESLFPGIKDFKDCLDMITTIVPNIDVNDTLLKDDKYRYMFSVEEVNRLVQEGMPFRDAYHKVSAMIRKNEYSPHIDIHHTHEGSMGNLCNNQIKEKLKKRYDDFGFETADKALKELLKKLQL